MTPFYLVPVLQIGLPVTGSSRHWPPLTIQKVKTAFFRVITQRVVVITDVPGQPIGPIFKGQDTSRNVSDKLSQFAA